MGSLENTNQSSNKLLCIPPEFISTYSVGNKIKDLKAARQRFPTFCCNYGPTSDYCAIHIRVIQKLSESGFLFVMIE